MQKRSSELKVGLFVLISLIVLAVLLLQFSRGTTLFGSHYTLYLESQNVSGMVQGASVQVSGVRVGRVSAIALEDDGRTVRLELTLDEDFPVYPDATFAIETSGFLGDQFVAIYPRENEGEPLKPGAIVQAEPPFNIQEMARAATGFINRINHTAERLNDAVTRIDRMILNEETLSGLAASIENLRTSSAEAIGTVQSLQLLIETNAPTLGTSLSNVLDFSEKMNVLARDLDGLIGATTGKVSRAADNLEATTGIARELLEEVRAGRGLAGSLVADDELSAHISQVASNLSVTTSNLNSLGLWRILWKPKPPKEERRTEPPDTIYQGRSPFD